MGVSRQEYWGGFPFPSPGDLPDPGIEPRSPALEADALTSEPPGKQVVLVGKDPPANAGDIRDAGSIPGVGRSPEEGQGNPLQYSCLRIPWTGATGGLQSVGSQLDTTEQLTLFHLYDSSISRQSHCRLSFKI